MSDRFQGWKVLLRARGHVIKHAPIQAIIILWNAEYAVVNNEEPRFWGIFKNRSISLEESNGGLRDAG